MNLRKKASPFTIHSITYYHTVSYEYNIKYQPFTLPSPYLHLYIFAKPL